MSRSLSLAALALVLLAGCGGQPTGAERVVAPPAPAAAQVPAAAPVPAPTPSHAPAPVVSDATSGPPDAVAKQNVRMAVSAMETYYGENGSYTSDVASLASMGFPSTVRVERFAADGYTLSSTTADGSTYAMDRSASLTIRRCSPIKPPFCRDGTW